MKPLYDFFDSVRGPAGRFTFVDFNGIDEGGLLWTLFVTQGDGVAVTWDLPTFGIAVSPLPRIFEDGIEKTVEVYTDAVNPAINYHVHVGGGTDGLDTLLAQNAPAAGKIVTITAKCRRAFRKAMFVNAKNPFSVDTPATYAQAGVTIVEVRK
jgi:hypothetical protein